MSKEKSDEENLSSNESSEQNDSESDEQELIKKSSKKVAKIDSDSNESDDNKSNQSSSEDDEDDDEKKGDEEISDKANKSKSGVSSDDEKSEKGNSDDSEREKSNKESNEEKSDDDKKLEEDKSDDEEENFFSTKRKSKKIMDSSSSDSEIEQNKKMKTERKNNEEIEDIFGELSDEDELENENKLKVKSENNRESDKEDNDESRNINDDEDNENVRDIFQQFDEEEDDEQQQQVVETRIDVLIPKIVADLGKECHFVKLPNFLSVDTHPYDPAWYEDEIDEDEMLDDEGRARMKLKVENTIRWRNVNDKDGNMSKESNTRIVKWSDGSMSLHLGSEIFDIHKQHLLAGDNNHLYIRQGTGLQGQSVFKTKLTFRPHSTDSFTHKKMTLSLADRSQKTQKIRVLPTVGLDPEANRIERIKKEEDKLRASLRRENTARRVREKVNQRGPTASYLEPDADDDDEGVISLDAIKNRYKQPRGSNFANVFSDESESDKSQSSNDSLFNKKKTSAVKRTGRIEESDED